MESSTPRIQSRKFARIGLLSGHTTSLPARSLLNAAQEWVNINKESSIRQGSRLKVRLRLLCSSSIRMSQTHLHLLQRKHKAQKNKREKQKRLQRLGLESRIFRLRSPIETAITNCCERWTCD